MYKYGFKTLIQRLLRTFICIKSLDNNILLVIPSFLLTSLFLNLRYSLDTIFSKLSLLNTPGHRNSYAIENDTNECLVAKL